MEIHQTLSVIFLNINILLRYYVGGKQRHSGNSNNNIIRPVIIRVNMSRSTAEIAYGS
jgi:hypothetical protein